MSDALVEFDTDGLARAVYDEETVGVLRDVGSVSISRATNIEYNNKFHRWEVLLNGKAIYGAATRKECIEWEVAYLHERTDGRLASLSQ